MSAEQLKSSFIEACRGGRPEKVPVWLMRQAGRYLPEYRAVRGRVTFEQLCRTPELAAEVTLQPIRRYKFDAAIIFSDILVASDALGRPVHFPEGGPVLANPVRSRADIDALERSDPRESLGFVLAAHRLVRAALPPTTALIGFAGAPLTVASYMVEGGASKSFERIKGLLYGAPSDAHALLATLTELTADYLRAQVEAGAGAIQVFDTWAGIIGRADFEAIVAPHLRELFARIADLDVPKIYFARDAAHLLPLLRGLGASVYGLDWALSIDEGRAALGDPLCPVQGNLDPVLLLTDEGTLRRRVRSLIAGVSERAGFIFNLGHGVLKDTAPELVAALVDEVRSA